MSDQKRHHYIPRMLLKQFVDEEGMLYFFDKRMPPERGVQRTSPRHTFVERGLYTSELDGNKDIDTEKFLGRLERQASPIIGRVVKKARIGELPNLTPCEKDVLCLFVFTLIKRSPDTREEYMSRLCDSEMLRYWYRATKKTERIDPVEMKDLIRKLWPTSLRAFDKSLESEVLPTLRGMRIGIGVLRKGQTGLVIGSSPSVRIGYTADLRDRSVQLWMAIARDVAVIFSHDDGAEMLGDLTNNDIQKFNKEIAKASTVIAGHSRGLIATLAA